MNEKVYPMYDSYNLAVTQLVELIEARDRLIEALKAAPPGNRREGQQMLDEVNKKIASWEASLSKEYETHQLICREKEKLEAFISELSIGTEGAFIYIKHCLPDKFEIVKTVLFTGWTPEEIEAFNARVAHLEATRLEDFIGENKEQ